MTAPKEEEQESLSQRIADRTGLDIAAIRKEVQDAYAAGDISGLRTKYPFLIPTRAAAAEGGMMDLGGNEMDLRGGGFVPIGKKRRQMMCRLDYQRMSSFSQLMQLEQQVEEVLIEAQI